VGKTVQHVFGLACILRLNWFPMLIFITTKKRSADLSDAFPLGRKANQQIAVSREGNKKRAPKGAIVVPISDLTSSSNRKIVQSVFLSFLGFEDPT